MSFRHPPKVPPAAGRHKAGATDRTIEGKPSALREARDLPPDLFARIEASARDIAERIAREDAAAAGLRAELEAAPAADWTALAASGRFALPAFLEALCEESWSLPPERSEALAKFGDVAARGLDAASVGSATAAGLSALTRASLGDAWRRQGRRHDAELAFLGAFGQLVESEDAIDFGLVQALYSRLLRDRGDLAESYFEALRAAQNLRREAIAPLAAGAWGEVAALAAEIGAWGRVDSALRAARREAGTRAQAAAARSIARGVLRLRLLRQEAAANALALAAQLRLKLDGETRRDFAAWTGRAAGPANQLLTDARPLGVRGRAFLANPSTKAILMTDPNAHVPQTGKPESDPEADPPVRDPSRWEELEGFRHTFLLHFTRPGDAAALRQVARLLYDGALEAAVGWPRSGMLPVLEQTMAGAFDLRFLEGYFGMISREGEESSLARAESRISHLAGEYAAAAGALAARIEQDLAAAGMALPAIGR